jgi:hypothetical protein
MFSDQQLAPSRSLDLLDENCATVSANASWSQRQRQQIRCCARWQTGWCSKLAG